MLLDGLTAVLGTLALVGLLLATWYIVRSRRRSSRIIGDRERQWALGVIALATLTKIPTVLPLLPELMKAGVVTTLAIVPLIFLFNMCLALAVWKRRLGLGGVVVIIVLQTLNQYGKTIRDQDTNYVWGFSIAAETKPCEAYTDRSVAAATTGGWISDLDKTWRTSGGKCVTRNHGRGTVVLCQDATKFAVLGFAVGRAACAELETEVTGAAQRTRTTDADALSSLLSRG